MKSVLENILKKVHKGELNPEDALLQLKGYPYEDLDFAKIDHHRELRRGFPEIVFGLGKTQDQILEISRTIMQKGSSLLVTRVEPETHAAIKNELPAVEYNELGRAMFHKVKTPVSYTHLRAHET